MQRTLAAAEKRSEAKAVLDLPPGVRRYDFRTPRKLNPAQRLRLGGIYSKLAPRLSELFQELLQNPVETTFLGLEQVQAQAWINAEATDVVVCEVGVKPGPGRFYIAWPRRLAFFFLEKLLGGTGEELFIEQELSDLESGILWKITHGVIREIKNGWRQAAFQEGTCERFLGNLPSFTEACGPDILLIASLTVHSEPVEGKLGIIFPYPVVKNWLEESAGDAAAPAESTPHPEAKGLPPALVNANCTLTARLRNTPIRISDFMNLQEGDCLQLNHPAPDPIHIYVNGRLKYQGHIGLKGRQLAVKITALAEAGTPGDPAAEGGKLHGAGKPQS